MKLTPSERIDIRRYLHDVVSPDVTDRVYDDVTHFIDYRLATLEGDIDRPSVIFSLCDAIAHAYWEGAHETCGTCGRMVTFNEGLDSERHACGMDRRKTVSPSQPFCEFYQARQ